MRNTIQVWINGFRVPHHATTMPIGVCESDRIQLRVMRNNDESEHEIAVPEIYFEDYQAHLEQSTAGEITWHETPTKDYFSACFGSASLRIEFSDAREIIEFDVSVNTSKASVEQVQKMIQYLSSRDGSLIQSFFARTTQGIGSIRTDSIDMEMVLSRAESFLEKLQAHQPELANKLRKRLVPVRVPLWETDRVNCEIDPYDVISNLDALTPSSGDGDVFLRGRNYDLASIDVTRVAPTADVNENRVLLGGLYSIRRKLSELMTRLTIYAVGQLADPDERAMPKGFESLSRLMLRLCAGGMISRCTSLLNSAEGFIRFFERKLGVRYFGEIMPKITPYARSIPVYKILFIELSLWYELGTPNLDFTDFLMKLKSMSKIYEIVAWFHLLDSVERQGWILESALPHKTMGTQIPSSVVFTKVGETLSLQYEPLITRPSINMSHMDLVDVFHKESAQYPYWEPDFVIRLTSGNAFRYLILDAKYSSRSTLDEYSVVQELFNKYFENTAVYDAKSNTISNACIMGVFAVHPPGIKKCTYFSWWNGDYSRLSHGPTRVPMIGRVGLMVDDHDFFDETLASAMAVLRRTLPQSM